VPHPPSPLVPAAALALAALYAALRYVVFGDVPASDLPLFVANKAIAVASAALLALAAVQARRRSQPLGDVPHLRSATALAFLHVFATLALLRAPYDAKLLDATGRYSWAGSLALLAGAITAALLRPARHAPRAALALCVALIVHTAALGGASWWSPSGWPGGLPPLTLLSALIGLLALAALLAARRRQDGQRRRG
jgi:hypothetical protein